MLSVTVIEAPPAPAVPDADNLRPAAAGDDVEPDSSVNTAEVGASADDDAPHWPDEAAESSFLAEQPTQVVTATSSVAAGAAASKVQGAEGESEPPVSLPQLQSLIDRIPADAMETLDELFRARFVSVKRVQKSSLKGPDAAEA